MSALYPEERKSPRREVLAHACVVAGDEKVYCVVRDLSATGARLGIPRQAKLPQSFDMVVRRKLKLRVVLKWRNGDFAGVAFLEPLSLATRMELAEDKKFALDC